MFTKLFTEIIIVCSVILGMPFAVHLVHIVDCRHSNQERRFSYLCKRWRMIFNVFNSLYCTLFYSLFTSLCYQYHTNISMLSTWYSVEESVKKYSDRMFCMLLCFQFLLGNCIYVLCSLLYKRYGALKLLQ